MLYLVVGSLGFGKTTLIRDHLLPILLFNPRQLTPLAPERFRVALIQDPIRGTTGASYPGQRFHDVAQFRRAGDRKLVCCFDDADPDALLELALEVRGCVLVLDEIDNVIKQGPALTGDRKRIVDEGRHYGVCTIGSARRLHAVNIDARNNCMGAWITNLTDGAAQKAAGKMIGASRDDLAAITYALDVRHGEEKPSSDPDVAFSRLKRGEFVQWNREDNVKKIIIVQSDGILEVPIGA